MGLYEELQNSDWLNRNSCNYTSQKKTNRMDWERSLKKGEAYSTFLLRLSADDDKIPDDVKLVYIRNTISKVISAMNVKKQQVQVRINADPNMQSFHKAIGQGKHIINVSLEPFANRDIRFPSFNHALDVTLGFSAHEMLHANYTHGRTEELLKKYVDTDMEVRILNDICNIVDDESIESVGSKVFAGYMNYIAKAKEYVFDVRLKQQLASMENFDNSKLSKIIRLMNCIVSLIRYPSSLEKADVDEFESELREVMEILTPYPEPDRVVDTSYKVFKVVSRYIEKQTEQQDDGDGDSQDGDTTGEDEKQSGGGKGSKQKKEKNQSEEDGNENKNEKSEEDDDEQSGGGGGEEDDDELEPPNGGRGTGDTGGEDSDEEREDEDDAQDGSPGGSTDDSDGAENEEDVKKSGDGSPDNDSSDPDDNKDGNDTGKGAKNEISPEELEEVLDAVAKLIEAYSDAADISDNSGTFDSDDIEAVGGMSDEQCSKLENSSQILFPPRTLQADSMLTKWIERDEIGDGKLYNEIIQEIATSAVSMRAKMQRFNRNQRDIYKGMYDGHLDEDALVEAVIGAKNVYQQSANIRNTGSTIVLLIDESGSMHSTKIDNARKIAVMFERALLGQNNIDFYCYGHSTAENERTAMYVYYEGRKRGKKECLVNVSANMYNRDGMAILETIGRVRSFTDQPIIMFMISDGMPSASVPGRFTPVSYTKHCVEFVEKSCNAQIIHVAIDGSVNSNTMFTKFVKFTNMQTLVNDLGRLLTKTITKLQQPETTFE